MDQDEADFIECVIDSIAQTRKKFYPKIVQLLNRHNTLKMDILLNCEKNGSRKCDCRNVTKNDTGDSLGNSRSFLCCVHNTGEKGLSEDCLLFQMNQNYKLLLKIDDKVKRYEEENEQLEISKIPDLTGEKETSEVLIEMLSRM